MQRDRVEWGDIGIRQNRVGLASVGWGCCGMAEGSGLGQRFRVLRKALNRCHNKENKVDQGG